MKSTKNWPTGSMLGSVIHLLPNDSWGVLCEVRRDLSANFCYTRIDTKICRNLGCKNSTYLSQGELVTFQEYKNETWKAYQEDEGHHLGDLAWIVLCKHRRDLIDQVDYDTASCLWDTAEEAYDVRIFLTWVRNNW